MKILKGAKKKEALNFINQAAKLALRSNCLRAKCGSIIVYDWEEIGIGWNGPPQDIQLEHCLKDYLPEDFKSDRTCCIHAEQRAIFDALRRNPDKLKGSEIYFIRLDESNKKEFAGEPYCTICSKMALEVGISDFVLYRKEGICVWDICEYNERSFGR